MKKLKTRQKMAHRFIDEIIQCADKSQYGGQKFIDKHYIEIIEDIKKEIVKNLK